MSDSVDRVFVHALATVRRLPRTGSSRPPPTARLRLYGLYKQSMEGDVSSILPRPALPPNSPNPNDPASSNPTVYRYASRDVRTRELQSEIEKWDAWHSCAGMTRTEAKRRYITTLIETMKEYASGTSESRELVSELEFVWNQIKSQSGSEESESGESPTRKLERAGLKRTQSIISEDRTSPGPATPSPKPAAPKGSLFSRIQNSVSNLSASQLRPQQNLTGLKVLSPISQKSDDDIVENEEILEDQDEDQEEDEDEPRRDEEDDRDQTPKPKPKTKPKSSSTSPPPSSSDPWRLSIESQLKQLTLELTALREQLSSHHLLSRSSFSSSHYPIHYTGLPLYRRLLYRLDGWVRWLLWTAVRQVMVQTALLVTALVYGRVRGDRRVEDWIKGRLKDVGGWVRDGRVTRALQGTVL